MEQVECDFCGYCNKREPQQNEITCELCSAHMTISGNKITSTAVGKAMDTVHGVEDIKMVSTRELNSQEEKAE